MRDRDANQYATNAEPTVEMVLMLIRSRYLLLRNSGKLNLRSL